MKRSQNPFKLLLPASSANVGPAFDSAALALQLYLRVEAKLATEFKVTIQGRDQEKMKRNLILETYEDVLASQGKASPSLSLSIRNQIPIGRGCGSSAAARLAGIALAVHFGDLGWSSAQIVHEGAVREKHADNVAACWLGGFAVTQWLKTPVVDLGSPHAGLHTLKVAVKKAFRLLLVVPDESLPTEQARGILPNSYPRADAVNNVQSAMLLVLAFTQGRSDYLPFAFHDCLHEPYRASLCPLLPLLRGMNGSKGILGVVLSGAGPSVLLVLDPAVEISGVARAVRACLKRAGQRAELILTAIETSGGDDSFSKFHKQDVRKAKRHS